YLTDKYQTKLIGVESNNGNKVYVIHITGPNGVKKIIRYDVKSGLKTQASTSNGQKSSTVQYSNYKSVNGILIPFERTSSRGPGQSMTEKVQSVKINSGLKDSAFE